MDGEICTDNRFEIIAAYKKKLIEGTNIESSPDEMAVIDNILFRFWQMDWLPPIPHGRLGDLDNLEEGLRHMAKYQHGERQQGILGCCETIRSAPVVIPASEES
jgi:hypothetical protein